MNNPLVSSQWLFENLKHPDLIILDASVKKVTSKSDNASENISIKGARYFDLKNNFSTKGAELPNTLPNATQFEAESQKLGINSSSLIITYDNLGIYSSPRVWWMFKIMGHKNVMVLNGGLPNWKDQGYPTEEIKAHKILSGNFKAALTAENVKDYTFIKSNLNNQNNLVIDARSAGRFNGT